MSRRHGIAGALSVLAATGVLLACGRGETGMLYVGSHCHSIDFTTTPAHLPLGPRVPLRAQLLLNAEPFILADDQLACCASHLWGRSKPASCFVDCGALATQFELADVGSPFRDEACGADGVSRCSVVLDHSHIVGVWASCND